MRCFAILAFLSLALTAHADELQMTAPPEPADMKSLFNGKDLDGWDGDPRLWSVRDGMIHGETTQENKAQGNTFLIWQGGEPADFELRLSFRCNATNNSGIQYRSSPRKARNKWSVKGYQHEVRNEVNFPNVPGFIYDEGGKRGRLNAVGQQSVYTADGKKKVIRDDLMTQEAFKKLMKLDEFNDVVIIAKGNHIRHYLNGKLLIDFKDEHPELALSKGLIALQLHAGKPMFAEFKNIRIKIYK